MNYRVLGKSGIAVSELCLGTMTFGNTTNEQDSIEMVHRFFWIAEETLLIRRMCMSPVFPKRSWEKRFGSVVPM